MSTVVTPAVSFRSSAVHVPPWPSEKPRFILALCLAIPIWIALIVTMVGGIYALFIGLFILMAKALFIYHVRANGVRVGPEQFPEIYSRVAEIAEKFGLERAPDTYIMQAGGALNALATRFLGANMMVLYSDLLRACEGNQAARDMIIGHELGHIRAGHLEWRWLIAPALLVPFLAGALSRAREFTCDRYGMVGAGQRDGAELGLIVLAAGGELAPQVNRRAFVRQRAELGGFWMGFAHLMATHPPLTRRVAALAEFRL